MHPHPSGLWPTTPEGRTSGPDADSPGESDVSTDVGRVDAERGARPPVRVDLDAARANLHFMSRDETSDFRLYDDCARRKVQKSAGFLTWPPS